MYEIVIMNHSIFLKDPGIYKKNTNYYYHLNNKKVTDTTKLEFLKNIYVPPAWDKLWYASNKNCHIHVHGIDSSGKRQYILNPAWIQSKKYEKFKRMILFTKKIPLFFKKIKINYSRPSTDKEYIIKLLFNLLLDTHIRVGNEIYSRTNKTYGLTTLRKKHLVEKEHEYYFIFVGKSKIQHTIKIPSKYYTFLSTISLPLNNSDHLFRDNSGELITSESLNEYLKENMGPSFTCKDFRTYSANVLFIESFKKLSKNTKLKPKEVVLKSIIHSSNLLGNSKNICKKSYISDTLLNYCTDSFTSASGETVESLLSRVTAANS